ncbi:MAG: MipA/OmpV family protein [Rhizobiales bacterium]|nr:MipA/OmpV family protein [Hyphomicrobiales bacterium]
MRRLLGIGFISLFATTSLLAQDSGASNNWNLTLGIGARVTPQFMGSSEYSIRPRPVFGLSRGLTSRWHSAADDAIGPGLIFGENWRAGLSGAILWERRESSDRRLRGLGNVPFGFEAGAFAEYYVLPWLRARADLRRGFLAHDAVRGELKLDAFGSLTDKLSFGLGPRVVLATADFNRTYLGVTAAQVAASGLPAYRPKGGVESIGFLTQATYAWTPRLRTTVSAEYRQLVGDAGRAPLVRQRGSRDQFSFGLATSYTFDLGR